MKKLCIYTIIIGISTLINSCNSNKKNNIDGFAIGTYYSISYMGKENKTLQYPIDSIFNLYSSMFSVFDTNSLISKINNNQTTEINEDFKSIFLVAQEISSLTEGAFDITVAPLVNLWGFGKEEKKDPTQKEIDSVIKTIGYQKLSLENNHIVKENLFIQLNFNAIAKGYIVDKIAVFLSSQGYSDYLVDVGGEVFACNKNQNKWKVGIQIPTKHADDKSETDYVFYLNNKAVATSGNYRNYYEKDGERFSHIINPLTGKPEQNKLLSVTVLADNCTYADALATAFMIMDMDKSLQFLASHPEYAAYFIYNENNSYKHIKTANFPDKIN
ncbi:MAG TPA: FAD:protein FMN transferase [Bacteroidales bacterium]|nr:FAD:protein FMN transferase [Bacteroidales bacterium]HQB20405.1 FAD:protein FMN transferase [Bacteroidales bacterium]